jgi:hypothetical protein
MFTWIGVFHFVGKLDVLPEHMFICCGSESGDCNDETCTTSDDSAHLSTSMLWFNKRNPPTSQPFNYSIIITSVWFTLPRNRVLKILLIAKRSSLGAVWAFFIGFLLFLCYILGNEKPLCYKYRTSIFRYVKYAYEPYGTVLPYCRTVTSLIADLRLPSD